MEVWETKPEFISTVLHDLKKGFGLLHQREGIHLTDCLLCLRKAYFDKVDSLPPSEEELLYHLLGLGLQSTFHSSLGATTIERNGILLNPDFVSEKGTPVELKTTRISRKRLDSHDFPEHWIRQLMGYCYALGVKEGDLLILTLIHPELINYHIVFGAEELSRNWGSILDQAERLKSALEKRTPPDGSYDWQCEGCRYRLRCQVEKGGQKNVLSEKNSDGSE